eukprot:SM000083S22784  [mRNA]  locus=s83:491885:492506:- [translate_table: standard]
MELRSRATKVGLPTFVISDAGRTQVAAGSKTVLAVGPGFHKYITLEHREIGKMAHGIATCLAVLQVKENVYNQPGAKQTVDTITRHLRLL